MTQTIGQLPRCNPPRPKRNVDALIGATLLFVFASFPRLFILAFWIFGSELGDAFGSWIIPAVGFIVAPWTTLLYAWMWAISSEAVTGIFSRGGIRRDCLPASPSSGSIDAASAAPMPGVR